MTVENEYNLVKLMNKLHKEEAQRAAAKMLAGPHTTLPDGIKSVWDKSVKQTSITWKK